MSEHDEHSEKAFHGGDLQVACPSSKTIGQIRDSGCDGRHANKNTLILAPTCRYFGVGD